MNQNNFIHQLYLKHQQCTRQFPDKTLAIEFIEGFFEFLFISNRQQRFSEYELIKELESYRSHLATLVYDVIGDGVKTQTITEQFFDEVENVYQLLQEDAEAVVQFDPAAESTEEVMVAYPGFFATVVYRFSNLLWRVLLFQKNRKVCFYSSSLRMTGVKYDVLSRPVLLFQPHLLQS